MCSTQSMPWTTRSILATTLPERDGLCFGWSDGPGAAPGPQIPPKSWGSRCRRVVHGDHCAPQGAPKFARGELARGTTGEPRNGYFRRSGPPV